MGKRLTIKQHLKSLTISQYFAIGILVFFISATFLYVLPSMYDWNSANIDLQKARTFHTTFFYYFSGQRVTPEGSIPDIQVDLTISYQHATLIVDEPVTISGIAVVNTSMPQQIRSITFHFQNALAYPVRQNVNNITEGSNLFLDPTLNSSKYAGTATLTWTLEGTYNPYFAVIFENSTGVFATPLGVSPDVSITVYPKEQFAQIVTSNGSMILAISVYLLTLVGTGSLVLSLWDRKSPSQEDKYNTETSTSETKISKGNANVRVTGKTRDNNTKPDDKQTHKH
jgi:hypothetical protein